MCRPFSVCRSDGFRHGEREVPEVAAGLCGGRIDGDGGGDAAGADAQTERTALGGGDGKAEPSAVIGYHPRTRVGERDACRRERHDRPMPRPGRGRPACVPARCAAAL